MKDYDFAAVEAKWQKIWEEKKCFKAVDFDEKPKFYGLIEFPYPSGVGLHVGHIRAYTSIEIVARKRRLQGYNVLFPIGWDAFGLPTENYAIQTGRNPRDVTDNNIVTFTKQLKSLGYSFDWDREIDTTDPEYYKWTQWIFLQLYKNNLAYKDKTYVNFCNKCKVVLANEESQGGKCDRCGSEVVQLEKDVWFLRIKQYSEKLLEGLKELDFPPRIKLEQENWIGKSMGAEIFFDIKDSSDKIVVYTTRPDTVYGATFLVIAPEHPLIEKYKGRIKNIDAVKEYQEEAKRKNEFERVRLVKDKTGVMLDGLTAINPLTSTEIPVFISDYVMLGYGTGAIMAVPAHDTRDWDFAKKFNLPIIEVVKGGDVEKEAYTECYEGELVNSGILNGLNVADAKVKITEYLTEKNIGSKKINYNMKDWAFNRQRYWGEPIPIINCPKCGMVPVPEDKLPLRLPSVENYKPTTTGESPLALLDDWVNCKCPKCGSDSKRETDTMPQWAGSSWYFLRYMDPHNDKELASKEKMKYWGPIDWYNGGMEHVTRHLIYSRFWNIALNELGIVPFKEPYKKRSYQGLILGEDGEKMSKARGNVVNPSDYVEKYGADVLRSYIMFIGDYEKPVPWSNSGINGIKRFLDRVAQMDSFIIEGEGYCNEAAMHSLIKKVSDDIEAMKFNTALAELMKFSNIVYSSKKISRKELGDFAILLSPFAPHMAEEIWQSLGNEKIIAEMVCWPEYDESIINSQLIKFPIQVNGKVRGFVNADPESSIDDIKALIDADASLSKRVDYKNASKEIFIRGKIVNFIIRK